VFDFDRVNKAGARFDWDKLNWLNSQVLHERSAAQLLGDLQPLWTAQGWSAETPWLEQLCALLGPSLVTLQDGLEQARPFFERPALNEAAQQQLASDGARPALAALLERLPEGALDADAAQALLGEAVAAAGVKKGVLMKTLRAALLGSLQGPDLLTTWLLLQPSGEARERIARCL
ncbi:MAG: glutamate--tRNA ligase, partial [Vulcanococcus sp.]